MNKLRILLAEDHAILREGLNAFLTAHHIEAAEDAPDTVLMLIELTTPDLQGIEVITEMKRRLPGAKILVLAEHRTNELLLEALRAGADGYVLKQAASSELLAAIKSVLEGNIYWSQGAPAPTNSLHTDKNGTALPCQSLTDRECEVLRLIAGGRTNKHIARELNLSVKTVEKHRSNIMKKLGIHNACALTAFAIGRGLADPSSVCWALQG